MEFYEFDPIRDVKLIKNTFIRDLKFVKDPFLELSVALIAEHIAVFRNTTTNANTVRGYYGSFYADFTKDYIYLSTFDGERIGKIVTPTVVVEG